MPKSRQRIEEEVPLYIRWTPDICPYALEMRLDLITRLKAELYQAESLGVEIGGLFVGVFPTPDSPTLRLDDVVFVPRDVVGGSVAGAPEFKLAPGQRQRLAELTAQARHTSHPAVGFFRSHLRTGPLSPTSDDLAVLQQQFPEGLFAFLLIGPRLQPNAPRQAAFYLAVSGDLPDTPSSQLFPFDEAAFQSLPEIPAEATEDVRNFNFAPAAPRPIPWPAVISLLLLLFLIGTWTLGSHISQLFRPNSNQIDLSVVPAGTNLKITWDHSTPILAKSAGATLVIMDGRIHRELKLDSDELKLGQIAYERLTKKVYVVLQLDSNGKKIPPQTYDWSGD